MRRDAPLSSPVARSKRRLEAPLGKWKVRQRAVVEAMLTGAVPLVARGGGHHLSHLVSPHEVGEFHCDGPEDYARRARGLQDDPELLRRLSQGAHAWAVTHLCQAFDH